MKMNKRQMMDAKECEEMQECGEYKDCAGCSCNVCVADEPDYTDLLQECYDELSNWITEECVLIWSLKKALGIN